MEVKDRYCIIGRVLEGKNLVAYKIYNATTRKMIGVISKERVHLVARKVKFEGLGTVIVGLSVSEELKVVRARGLYQIDHTDMVDGNGNLVKSFGRKNLVSYSGFADTRQYRLVDSDGNEEVVPLEQFKVLVMQGKVNGARYSGHYTDNGIGIYKYCNYREI